MDKELLLHEAMARLLSREGSNWMGSGNSALSVALEHYLNGSAQKDEAGLIEEALTEANLTLSIFVLGPLRMRPGTSRWWMI